MRVVILCHHGEVAQQLPGDAFSSPQVLAYMNKPNGSKDYRAIVNSAWCTQSGCSCLGVRNVPITCHEQGAQLQNWPLPAGQDPTNADSDFHGAACLSLLGLATEKENSRQIGFKGRVWFCKSSLSWCIKWTTLGLKPQNLHSSDLECSFSWGVQNSTSRKV